ncbi:M10 family metallopeptidase [Pseudomonas sp. SG20052]|uniref:M10 family metallopeptidase n=1 Tax=Pseudomonas sp. SG20052 TaxID=3074147 RepID=UPI00287F4B24|nr:M10 family metallopeptidase [Pseudomonas sp. SG20052]WNF54712.1 M10 family metallopeptidase [Pseudomonas sp. SG20052]
MPSPSGYTLSFYSSLTGIKPVDSLLSGSYWLGSNWTVGGPTNLSYSFISGSNSYFATNYSADNEYLAMYQLSQDQRDGIIRALSSWSAVANIKFTQTTDNISNVGDLRFGGYALMKDQAAAWAYSPSNTPKGGDVWIGDPANMSPFTGSYDYMTFIHEIGHAIGLKHPFSPNSLNATTIDPLLDDVAFTIMSYNNNYSYLPTTPMLLDILAIQSLYGANNSWMTGNNVYSWAATQSVFETIWDAGGIDSIDGSNQLAAVRINLNEGQFSQIGKAFTDQSGNAFNEGLAIAYGAKIENATGSSFDDTLIGNALDNILNGMAGADTMNGGAGNDTYVVDNIGDVIVETGTSLSEIDTAYSYIDYALGANVENLTFVGGANVNATGNALNNMLNGNIGNNILDGGAGSDLMAGDTGNDTYIVDNIGDVVNETSTLANEIDTVRSSVNYSLSANVENMVLTGTADIYAIGNAQNNVLTGNDGDNRLNGGEGLDTMIGGKGNDYYAVDQSGELALVQENANEGNDALYVMYNATAQDHTVDLNLSSLQNVENVQLLGNGAFTLLGNGLNNSLTGNADTNVLDGGLGADILTGGAGNDTYFVDNAGDVVVETSTLASEADTVMSSISYTLSANVEYLGLTGTANLNGTGNALNNVLIGTSGDNVLDGGLGTDLMTGGLGNDTYIVDNIGDVVNETSTLANEIDTVRSSVNYTLSANVENMVLTGTADIYAIGNAQNNVLTGNDGDNRLNGGEGLDTMIGGKGNDYYAVDQSGELALVQENANEGNDALYVMYNATAQDHTVDLNSLQNVENILLLGNGTFNLTGNSLDNSLTGNADANVLDGGLGADVLTGGAGNDTYIVDNIGDVVNETSTLANEIDTVRSSVNYSLSANVENMVLTGTADIYAIGNAQNNVLTGNDGDNRLNGGEGLDTMIGGKGNDYYAVDQSGELALVQENANEGSDALYVVYNATAQDHTVDLNLSNLQNVENILLLGNGAFTLLGNGLNNSLTGNADANVLDGGLGADVLTGGAGNDTYFVDNAGDVVVETSTLASEADTVMSSISYTLGANVEYLGLTGTANLNGTGNALNNVLVGNSGDNVLDGGLGTDLMTGGLGNDTYIVDNIGDVVNETSTLANEIDTVRSSVNYSLSANVENMVLTGTADIYAIGNAQNNVLTGNDGDNRLNGGEGLDTMIGGKGNDYYAVDQSGELALVQENANEGNDALYVMYNATAQDHTVDLNLSSLQNVENVQLLGNGAFTLLGNGLNNSLTGNADTNVLDGGLGADILTGGAGNDTYFVDNAGDVVVETSTLASEADTVMSSISYTLSANVEYLGLTGTANLNGTGNALNNVLIGTSGDNVLDGGLGTDLMTGGLGNDTYIVDNIGDVVNETSTLANEIDTVRSSVNYSLSANVENMVLTGTADIYAIGNAQNNVLTGNDGDNRLNGGEGLDTMIGGKGNDYYAVDQSGELALVQENANEGNDALYVMYNATAQDHTVDLNSLQNVENILLLGNGAFTLLGNDQNNTLTGNTDANTLNGGAGTDTLIGGAGADKFVFSSVSDMGTGGNRDVVTDFSTLQGDKIDLSQFDANLQVNGFNGFTFIGAGDFTGAGQLRFVDHVLSGNVSGNAGADFEIQLVGVNTFSATDLVA